MAGKTVLVTGAGGSIGSALAHHLMGSLADTVVLLDHSPRNLYALYREYMARHITLPRVKFLQADILHEEGLQEVFSRYQPHIVFHAAAMKHVAALESDPFTALENNVLGTVRLLEIVDCSPVEYFINVSTDKAVTPTSVLGISKRISELLLLTMESAVPRRVSLRLGNVLGSSGSVVPLFLESLENRRPLEVTDEQAARYFITLEEVVAFLMKSLETPAHSLLLPEMGRQRNILELASFLMHEFQGDMRGQWLNFVGLRDGEKRAEQLTYDHEYLEDTPAPQIYKVCGNNISDPEEFINRVARLLELVRHRRKAGLIEAMSAIVPEFTPSPTLLRYVH